MRKIFSLALALITCLSLFSLTGCKKEEDVLELNVYNWEDYICKDENADLIADFEEFATVATIAVPHFLTKIARYDHHRFAF